MILSKIWSILTFALENHEKGSIITIMETIFKETNVSPEMGFQIEFVTMSCNSPPHWHREMEILYILNGSAVLTMEGETYCIKPLDLMVVDSSIIHEVVYELPQTMGICIHISKSSLRRYMPDIELLGITCHANKPLPKQQDSYNRLCEYLKDLTQLYFVQKPSYPFASSALILSILAVLVDEFSSPIPDTVITTGNSQLSRVEQIFQYVEQHYKEPVELQAAADALGLNKEYFCRFFKKNTGMSFLQYVSHVRLNHIYQDLLYTDSSIQEIMESNGIFNYMMFYKQFKEIFHCTPRELRKLSRDNPYVQ